MEDFNYDGFVIESKPIRYKIDEEKLNSLANHINDGIETGLTEEEAECLLEWTIENTRCNIEKSLEKSIENSSLSGYCGFSQASTLFPLVNSGMTVTINNANNFPCSYIRHGFGTVRLPILCGDKVCEKTYLIDATYRQFFIASRCNEGMFSGELNDGLLHTPDPGYFMCVSNQKTNETVSFASELLKKGFIELTDENLKMYALGFIYSSIQKDMLYKYKYNKVSKVDINKLWDSIFNSQEYIDYDESEFDSWGMCIRIPNVNYENKKKM